MYLEGFDFIDINHCLLNDYIYEAIITRYLGLEHAKGLFNEEIVFTMHNFVLLFTVCKPGSQQF